MPERPKGADCKSAGYAFVGSNPTLGTKALLAQLVEHFHGKEEVSGSNPEEGSVDDNKLDGGVAQLVRAHDS